MKAKLTVSCLPALTEEPEGISFSQRWRGKFKTANKSDARYQALAKRFRAKGRR